MTELIWIYTQSTGQLRYGTTLCGIGYSGKGKGKNNPAMENVPLVGPIPSGLWEIDGPPRHTKEHGPYVLGLVPVLGTDAHGRTEFLIHGDSLTDPGEASEGCIIMPRVVRERIWQSGCRRLQVVSGSKEEMNAHPTI